MQGERRYEKIDDSEKLEPSGKMERQPLILDGSDRDFERLFRNFPEWRVVYDLAARGKSFDHLMKGSVKRLIDVNELVLPLLIDRGLLKRGSCGTLERGIFYPVFRRDPDAPKPERMNGFDREIVAFRGLTEHPDSRLLYLAAKDVEAVHVAVQMEYLQAAAALLGLKMPDPKLGTGAGCLRILVAATYF